MEEGQWAGLGYRRIAFLSRGPGEKEEEDQEHEGGAEQWLGSLQLGPSVMSDSLRPHESQQARPPCPSPTPGVYSYSCPSSR